MESASQLLHYRVSKGIYANSVSMKITLPCLFVAVAGIVVDVDSIAIIQGNQPQFQVGSSCVSKLTFITYGKALQKPVVPFSKKYAPKFARYFAHVSSFKLERSSASIR